MVGSSGSGKSSLINNVIGEDCLPIQKELPTPTTAQHVCRELLINNDNKYQCNFIELHIPDELVSSYLSMMMQLQMVTSPLQTLSPFYGLLKDQIAKNPYLREYLERLNLIIYVIRAGHLNDEDRKALHVYTKFFSQSNNISALVVTHCEFYNTARTRIVERFKSDELTNASIFGKGIYTVGFPNLTGLDDTDVKSSLKSKIQEDISKLHQLIKESSDSVDVLIHV